MKFLNKKIFLLIIIIVIFIIITGIVAVFYWQKLSIFEQESIPAEQESTEEELTQLEKDCLEEHDKMTQDEFLESIKVENLSFYESLTLSRYLELPIIFLVENNDWSMATTIKERRSQIKLNLLAKSLDIK